MMKNGPYLLIIQNLQFFHMSALISEGKHCLLFRHDYFYYNSTDFSQSIEKTWVWVGWFHRFGLRSFRGERNERL